MNEALEAKALATFAKQAPKGQRTIEDHHQHISYKMTLTTEDGRTIVIALIIANQGLTLSNLATLQAYKDRGYTFSYILYYNENNIHYCEISQVRGAVDGGQFKIDKHCLTKKPIG